MSSVDHICMNVARSKLETEVKFMEAAFKHIGFREVLRPVPHAVGLGTERDFYWLSAGKTDGTDILDEDMDRGYDRHIAILVKSRDEVDQFYKAAMDFGAKDNGPPGLRPYYHPNYYAAFVITPAGINLEALYRGPGPDAPS